MIGLNSMYCTRRGNEYPGKSLKKMKRRVIDDVIGEENWMPTDEVRADVKIILY